MQRNKKFCCKKCYFKLLQRHCTVTHYRSTKIDEYSFSADTIDFNFYQCIPNWK